MKVLLLSLLTCSLSYAADPPPVPDGKTPGRFTLLQTTVRYGTGVQDPVVMRIDTATGQVWTYDQQPVFGADGQPQGYVAVWKPTNEASGQQSQMADRSISNLEKASVKGR